MKVVIVGLVFGLISWPFLLVGLHILVANIGSHGKLYNFVHNALDTLDSPSGLLGLLLTSVSLVSIFPPGA